MSLLYSIGEGDQNEVSDDIFGHVMTLASVSHDTNSTVNVACH